jgi:D-3-phosphoglycerate dehydrogenase
MARWKILVSAPYMQPVIEQFRPRLEAEGCELVIPPVEERLEEDDLLALVADIDGALCGDDRFTERVMRASPHLKVIAKWGTGIDSIDREAAAQLNIAVRNTPNAFSEPVADSVYAYMLCFARRTLWLDRAMKAGEWLKLPGRALRECTLGVIGVGNVGKAVLRRAGGFGMRVLGNDIVEIDPAFVDEVGLEVVDKPALFREADFVSINCDLNPTSHHLMNDVAFDMMKSTGVLINTARGPIVDQPALIRALREGKIAGAGLDVFEEEPLPDDSPLLGFDNVLLAPHNANSSPEAWEHVHENTIRSLLEELKRRS